MNKIIMFRRIIAIITAIGLLGAGWVSVYAQTLESKYFSETGHNVKGEFLEFYDNNPNATFLYGYPITEEFVSKDGETVQYFQRARFEYHAELPAGGRVQLTPLGQKTFVSSGTQNINNSFACRTYQETGYAVCFAFLEFFDQYGGTAQFGYPISGFEYHEDKLVQYFERTRLEWQPWKAEGQRVVVSDLGRIYFDSLGEDPGLLASINPIGNAPKVITSLQVRAFVQNAVRLASDDQTIFLILQDQNAQPVSNAGCIASLHWPDGRNDSTVITTDSNGVGVISFSFVDQPYARLIYADINCAYIGLNATTTTSFRIWY